VRGGTTKDTKDTKRRGGGGLRQSVFSFLFSVGSGWWVVGGVVIVVARGWCWGENAVSG